MDIDTHVDEIIAYISQAISRCHSLSASQDVGQHWNFSIGEHAPPVFTTGRYFHFELQDLRNVNMFRSEADIEKVSPHWSSHFHGCSSNMVYALRWKLCYSDVEWGARTST